MLSLDPLYFRGIIGVLIDAKVNAERLACGAQRAQNRTRVTDIGNIKSTIFDKGDVYTCSRNAPVECGAVL